MQVESRGKNLLGATAGAAAHPKPNIATPFFGLIVPHLPVVVNFRKAGRVASPQHSFCPLIFFKDLWCQYTQLSPKNWITIITQY